MNMYDLYTFGNDAVIQEKGKATATIIRNAQGENCKPSTSPLGIFKSSDTIEYTSLFDAINTLAIFGNVDAQEHLFGKGKTE